MEVKDIAAIIGSLATAFAAIWAAITYRNNSRLEGAKWLASLYEKFYERVDLKGIREILDTDTEPNCNEDEQSKIEKLIREEPPEFTDYLNFFEFVAFLKYSKQLKYDEVNQLFGYYLDCLNRREILRQYVAMRGYELLEDLLKEYSEKTK